METVTATEAANRFGELAEKVRMREIDVVVVTRYGRPIVEIRRPRPVSKDS